MITLVYSPIGGLVLPDGAVEAWANALVRGGDCVVQISQIDLFSIARAAACANGNPEDLVLVTEGGELTVNKYGAYHGAPHPEVPAMVASSAIVEYAHRLRKAEVAQTVTLVSVEDWEAIDAKIVSIMERGRKIDAIKYLRQMVDMSLYEAKKYVDNLLEDRKA